MNKADNYERQNESYDTLKQYGSMGEELEDSRWSCDGDNRIDKMKLEGMIVTLSL